MKIILEEKDKDLLKEILKNLPEYSYDFLQCVEWHYEEMRFEFVEPDEGGKRHTLTLDKAMVGFQKFMDKELSSETGAYGLGDAANYDKPMVDEIVQFALLGRLVYG